MQFNCKWMLWTTYCTVLLKSCAPPCSQNSSPCHFHSIFNPPRTAQSLNHLPWSSLAPKLIHTDVFPFHSQWSNSTVFFGLKLPCHTLFVKFRDMLHSGHTKRQMTISTNPECILPSLLKYIYMAEHGLNAYQIKIKCCPWCNIKP